MTTWIQDIQNIVNDDLIEKFEDFDNNDKAWAANLYIQHRGYELASDLNIGDCSGLPDAMVNLFSDDDKLTMVARLSRSAKEAMLSAGIEAVEQMFDREELRYWSDEVEDTSFQGFKVGE